MKNILGIIAEYNPFHNGHLYHLQKSKEQSNCDYTIAIITGNFTQRGSTSLIDKWSKTKMAIKNGIDLVIELPLLYSISSAENFADGAIKIMNSLNIVDYVSFGTETTDLPLLENISSILLAEPIHFKNLLKQELHTGISFPLARMNALSKFLDTNLSSQLLCPNNILGIEYLKALKKYNSHIQPISVQRINSDYNSLETSNNIASATAIRNICKTSNNINALKDLLPASSFSIISEHFNNQNIILDLSTFQKEIFYTLRKMDIVDIAQLPDVSEGLEFIIKRASNFCNNLEDFFDIVKSKRYTYTRIQRILLSALLGITKKDIELSKNIQYPYIRVLGFSNNGKKILSEISKKSPNLQIITSPKKFLDTPNIDANILKLFKFDILATNIYTLGYNNNSVSNLDFTHNIIY